jgi:hypothetical protein
MAKPVTALEIGVYKFKSHFVHTRAAEHNLAANVTHSDLNINVGI